MLQGIFQTAVGLSVFFEGVGFLLFYYYYYLNFGVLPGIRGDLGGESWQQS